MNLGFHVCFLQVQITHEGSSEGKLMVNVEDFQKKSSAWFGVGVIS